LQWAQVIGRARQLTTADTPRALQEVVRNASSSTTRHEPQNRTKCTEQV